MIEVTQLSKRYGKLTAVDIPELKIPDGQSFGLVGNNGAGKTTFFSLILDLIKATTGDVKANGLNVAQSEDWKQFIGSYLDESFLIEFLSPWEYLEFIGKLFGWNKNDIEEFLGNYQDFIDTDMVKSNKLIRSLSKGNKSKVGIIASLIGNPEIIVLDEPFAHLDPSSQIRLKSILASLKEDKNITLLISSHDLKHVTDVCDRIVILDDGKIQKDIITTQETLRELEAYFAV